MTRSSSVVGLLASALAVAACSSGGGVPAPLPTSSASGSPPLVLLPGTVAKYAGTDSVAHVFPNPQGTGSNYTAGYTFVATRTVANASPGSPAAYDVNTVFQYALTQDPGQGIVRQSETNDAYSNQTPGGGGTILQNVGGTTKTIGLDDTAAASGGGPFTQTVATTTTFATPQTIGVYPLVGGTTIVEPIGRSVVQTTSDTNGATTETATIFPLSSTDTVDADGTYGETESLSNGESQTIVENANGSATISASGPLYALQNTIGVPANAGSGYVIPVTTFRQNATAGATPAPTATTLSYQAADWYPGGALPVAPFQTDTTTVKGAAALPSACSGAIAEPNVVEVDTSQATLNVTGSTSTTSQQRFDSNGTPVCVLRTVTTQAYSLTTGLPTQTTTETYAQMLTGLTLGSSPNGTRRLVR